LAHDSVPERLLQVHPNTIQIPYVEELGSTLGWNSWNSLGVPDSHEAQQREFE